MTRLFFTVVCVAASLCPHYIARADEFGDQLAALESNDEQKIEKSVEYFANQPLDRNKQADVSKALNSLDQDQRRQLAEPALKVWATRENIPLLHNILQEKRFDRDIVLGILEKLQDERSLEPLVEILNDPFDDGKKAEAILLQWGKSADTMIVRRINDPNDEIHTRLIRLWEQRKIGTEKRTLQSALDLASKEEQTRKYAAEWLAEQKTIPDSVKRQATESAIKILETAKGFDAMNATEIIADLGHGDFRAEYLKLLESKNAHQWRAGLHGVVHAKDVSCAKNLIVRMSDEEFGGQVHKILTRHGENAEPLTLALLKQPVEKDRGYAHIVSCNILSEIGTKKSVTALNALAKKRGIPASVTNAAKVAIAAINNRLQ